ncbi:MAG: LytR/AlgR family response regulator transcription factor [Bacteroidia bacterium]
MIKAIIIEDEERSREALKDMLTQQFRNVHVLAACGNINEGITAIKEHKPDLVFSDIELEQHTAFEMLQQIEKIDFEIIFTTAYEKYAIQAIKFAALDFLLKPFSISDLMEAMNRYFDKHNKHQTTHQFEALFHNLKHVQKDSKKIALPTLNGLSIIPLKEIIRCEADVNYTNFFLVSKQKIMVSKTLKEYEELLDEFDFSRVHGSHLINLHHVKNYTRGEGGTVTLSDGSHVDVSRRKKDEFLKRLAEI